MTKQGYVSKIVYRNAENGYTVMILENNDEEICCVGSMPQVEPGEYVEVEGDESFHPQYGDQLKVKKITPITPTEADDMFKYLASGAISGVGEALAKRIVTKFGADTFRIIEEEPERLAEIKGISQRIAIKIAEQFAEKQELRSAMMFLQAYGISNNLGVKIYNFYGNRMYEVLRTNPYRLAEDINGVGFKIADEIALNAGVAPDDRYRVRAALYYTLSQSSQNGHCYIPKKELFEMALQLVRVEYESMENELNQLALEKKVIIKKNTENVYMAMFYYMELNVARMLHDLNCKYNIKGERIEQGLNRVTADLDIELDDLQKKAVYGAVQNGVFILTGGPGTGKTTTINTIIQFFNREGMDVLLAAPTGRAAKRMAETTGMEAKTIHRLLELTKTSDGLNAGAFDFARNEANPLETDVIIIDEMSMVDISLVHALLKAVIVGTRVIFVGDVDQLPSVGPGNVLKDILRSEKFEYVTLNKIFRQAQSSSIIVNAHKINRGEQISLDNKANNDFFFLERNQTDVIVEAIIYLVKTKISGFAGVSPFEVQVLTPMRGGELGCEKLNNVLQNALNPESSVKAQKEFENGVIFREGDKVMQIKNDYQLEWEVKSKHGIVVESGMGVFNGDCGIIKEINLFAERIIVSFDEGRLVEYAFSQHDELVLAYAVTIHKSQGSEYPAVVIPLLTGPRMLFNRNVLYTAVTRAKKCAIIIGSADTVGMMITNVLEQIRYTGLQDAIIELAENS